MRKTNQIVEIFLKSPAQRHKHRQIPRMAA